MAHKSHYVRWNEHTIYGTISNKLSSIQFSINAIDFLIINFTCPKLYLSLSEDQFLETSQVIVYQIATES